MKRLFFAMAACAALLTSCFKDSSVGGQREVEIVVTTDQLQTRADDYKYGDGYLAYDLEYAVFLRGSYDEPIYCGEIKGAFPEDQRSTTLKLTLGVGMTYDVVFWADADDDPYTIDWKKRVVTMDIQDLVSQDERLDAFYTCEELVVSDDINSKTILLRRPFAQLNVATADMQDAINAGLYVTHTAINVSDVYTQMDLLSGEVIKESKTSVDFAVAPIPTGQNSKVKINNITYTLLSMNYLLVNARQTSNVTFKMYGSGGNFLVNTSYWTNIDLERNHRTYILGYTLQTNDIDFTVKIEDGFDDPDYTEGRLF